MVGLEVGNDLGLKYFFLWYVMQEFGVAFIGIISMFVALLTWQESLLLAGVGLVYDWAKFLTLDK